MSIAKILVAASGTVEGRASSGLAAALQVSVTIVKVTS